jgi:ComF family protein
MTQHPPFDRMISAASFEGLLKDIIHSFKYRNATFYKAFLGMILFEALVKEKVDCDLITFVPLHWTRMVSRGYNQAALIAGELAKHMDRNLCFDVLKKSRMTLPQVGLGRMMRKKNIRGAFRASGVKGKAVLVVDDVVTTGQTAREVSKALRKAGASHIVFASVGRMIT